jgi:S-adenosyl-L-methionine hydrolase (adenosine-forming)
MDAVSLFLLQNKRISADLQADHPGNMSVITLTTDFGHKDHYAAALRGTLLRLSPGTVIADITHLIPAYDIQQAAWVLRHAYSEFPKGSVHIVAVGAGLSRRFGHVAAKLGEHYFIGCDNGFFSLFGRERPEEVILLSRGEDVGSTFIARDLYAEAAVRIIAGEPLSALGAAQDGIVEKLRRQHPPEENVLKGAVAYIDGFGNLITDISRAEFDTVGRGRRFALELIGDEITQLHKAYADVPEGEKLALFNSSGVLEISINQGKASSLLSLRLNDVVRIVFED